MKPLLCLALLLTAACDFGPTPRPGAEPMVTGLGRSETSVKF